MNQKYIPILHEVFEIYVNNTFHQYLKLTDVKMLKDICREHDTISIRIRKAESSHLPFKVRG